jgi:hypothetical protein
MHNTLYVVVCDLCTYYYVCRTGPYVKFPTRGAPKCADQLKYLGKRKPLGRNPREKPHKVDFLGEKV